MDFQNYSCVRILLLIFQILELSCSVVEHRSSPAKSASESQHQQQATAANARRAVRQRRVNRASQGEP